MTKRGITLYLHVHQPYRVREYSVFDTSINHNYFVETDADSDRSNEKIINKVADKSYRPMNALLEKLLHKHPEFKVSLSITGTFIEQAEQWAPDVLESFKRLVATGQVEIVAETYYHSLSSTAALNSNDKSKRIKRKSVNYSVLKRAYSVTLSLRTTTNLHSGPTSMALKAS
jgi:alpha-amylase